MGTFSYLVLDILTVLFPIIWSFERKMYFFSKWKYVFPSMILTGLFFCIWDSIFTYWGVWGFNPAYHLSILFFKLPFEEILFFTVVPFSCFFIYETVWFLWRNKLKRGFLYQFSLVMGIFLTIVAIVNYDKIYTFFACLGSAVLLFYHCAKKNQINHEVLWISYAIILIPFTLVNGILTGYFTEEPIVWYNNNENLSIRFLTIPIEDFAYNLMLLLMNVSFYEHFLRRKAV